ncbi:MAG: Fic family protein [Chitinophagaceae bacterium]
MFNTDNAVKYHYHQFPPQSLDYNNFIHELLAAEQALARFDQMLKNLHNNEILLSPLRNQEAVLSSRMEGTISTMDEIMELQGQLKSNEEDGSSVTQAEVRSEIVETLLYQRALKNAQKAMEIGYTISDSLIKQIHQQLLSFGRGAQKSPGQYKTEQNYIGDSYGREISYIPVAPESLPEGMETLFRFIAESAFPVLVKTALMHLEFESLHPFKDSNGRIGRMLITLFLWQQKMISTPHFYISGFLEQHKKAYIANMRAVSEKGEWDEWCRYFFVAVKEQANKNLATAEAITALYEDMKKRFSEILGSKWELPILDYIFTYPKFRIPNMSLEVEIPEKSAAKIIKKLLDENIVLLQQEAAGRKPAIYSFEPLMQLVRV